jgi:hypothetical protein
MNCHLFERKKADRIERSKWLSEQEAELQGAKMVTEENT